jgi:hypothetical protein
MQIVRNPFQTPNGHEIMAWFSADIGVFSVQGCSLVRTNKGGIAAWLPRLDGSRDNANRNIRLHCEPTRSALLREAREMFIRMGGKGAEWRPRERDGIPDDGPGLHPFRGCDARGYPTHPLHSNYADWHNTDATVAETDAADLTDDPRPETDNEREVRAFLTAMTEDLEKNGSVNVRVQKKDLAKRERPPEIVVPAIPKSIIRSVSPPLPDRLAADALPPAIGKGTGE